MISEKDMALAVDFVGQTDLVGWYASEKLNGCRAYWDGERFWSREGRVIEAPEWFTRELPKIHLDGEIHAGRGVGIGNNNSAYKVAMTAVVHGGEWFRQTDAGEAIRFTAFDAPQSDGSWGERIASMRLDSGWFIAMPNRQDCIIGTTEIFNPRHLAEYMMELKRVGAEGAMFRNPDEIGYHAGKTGGLLRWKFLQ